MADTAISELKAKRKQWLEALGGQDRHSIINQLVQMTWDAATFRVVNEARRLAPPASNGGVQLNGLIHSLIDRGFFNAQIIAVRRLTDTYSLSGKRGVYSLIGLLKDLRKHSKLFTRKAILDIEGLAYDYEPIRREAMKFRTEKLKAGIRAYSVPMQYDSFPHERRHAAIDVLAGTTSEKRLPGDTIRHEVFDNLQKKVEVACNRIADHANKYIAHAATPENRSTVESEEANLTLAELWSAHTHLCQVAAFISIYILGDSCPGFLTTSEVDQFRYIENPLITSSGIGHLRTFWDSFEKECHRWSQWGLDAYAKEFS